MAGNTTGNIAYYKGGRRGAPSSTPAAAESGDVEDNSNNNSNNSNKLKSFDDDLPEGVDFSEGGWATDMAASLLGFLFFISALRNYSDDNHHFIFLHAGTRLRTFSAAWRIAITPTVPRMGSVCVDSTSPWSSATAAIVCVTLWAGS
jgi:hypothetical protein